MILSSRLNDGIFETLDRMCSSSILTYPIKAKIADLNDALDWYAQLAFNADGKWTWDDINQTSPPIDTQNIVSGTNRYKVGTFTEKIINLIRLEVADSSGTFQTLTPESINDFGYGDGAASGEIGTVSEGSFHELYLDPPTGTPTHYCKYGDFIYLRPSPNYNATSGLKAFFNRPAIRYSFSSVTVVAATDLFTATAHGLSAGDTVIFETDGTIPTGLTADTPYYVISSGLTADAFKVSTTLGGSTIDVTDAQASSNHSFLKTSGQPGIPLIHHQLLCRKAALTFRSLPNNAVGQGTLPALFQQVQLDATAVRNFFGGRTKDMKNRITAAYQNNH